MSRLISGFIHYICVLLAAVGCSIAMYFAIVKSGNDIIQIITSLYLG